VRRITPTVDALGARGATVLLCDLSKPETYFHALWGQNVLFHLAAENTLVTSDEKRVIQACLNLTQTVLTSALEAAIPSIVYTSSVVVLGRSKEKYVLLDEHARVEVPESPYVKGKLLAEQWVETQIAAGIDIRRVYPSWVVGPGNPGLTPPHKFIKDFAAKGQKFFFEGGVSIAHVQDVALGHILAFEKGAEQGQYILAGQNVTFKQLYVTLADIYSVPKPTIKIPKWLIYAAAKILGNASPLQASYVRSVINRYSWYDITKSEQQIGYRSRPAEKTLEDVKTEIQSRLIGTFFLEDKNTPAKAKGADLGTLLITGFPGWLGNRMVDILWNADERGNNKTARKVRLLVQPQFVSLLPTLPANFEIAIGDITDKESLLKATAGVSTVWHLAGVIYPKNLDLFEKVNVVGTKNLADACVANGVRRFLYMSTDSTCGFTNRGRIFSASEPANPYKNYGRSKYAGEQYIFQLTEQGMLEATSFRGFWFFGPNIPERNLSFFRTFSWPLQPVFGNGKNLRSISHCDDITDAFCRAEQVPATIGKWYWLPTFSQAQTVDEIYKMVSGAFNKKTNLFHVPNSICDLMSIADTLLTAKLHVLNSTIHAAGKFHKTIATDALGIETSSQDFGWQPKVTVGQIQREIVDSMSKN
jgi:nucleoside-diphosphate-sugar epimerase